MKRALVLSGGGSRGAYEIGAWQAFNELGVKFDAVYGTSIGALNAGLIAQGDLEKASDVWANITLKQVIGGEDEDFAIDRMISRKRDIVPFLMENAKRLRADIRPLEMLLRQSLDEGKVRASGMQLGVMTVRVPQMQPVPVRLSEMDEGRLADWLIASASCFPVFPTKKIGADRYMDGGYFDNLPIDMAIEDGAEEIVAVDIHPQPTHPEYGRMPFLKMIHPLRTLGGFLDFNPKLLKRMRLMGYYDTMKAYGAFDGIRYTFTHTSELKTAAQARQFMRSVAKFDAEAMIRTGFGSNQEVNAPLISALEEETPLKKLGWKEVRLRGLELCALQMGFREDAIYDPDDLTARILKFARMGEAVGEMSRGQIMIAAQMGRRELISYLYRYLKAFGEFPANCIETLAGFPRETAAALYLIAAQNG